MRREARVVVGVQRDGQHLLHEEPQEHAKRVAVLRQHGRALHGGLVDLVVPLVVPQQADGGCRVPPGTKMMPTQ